MVSLSTKCYACKIIIVLTFIASLVTLLTHLQVLLQDILVSSDFQTIIMDTHNIIRRPVCMGSGMHGMRR